MNKRPQLEFEAILHLIREELNKERTAKISMEIQQEKPDYAAITILSSLVSIIVFLGLLFLYQTHTF